MQLNKSRVKDLTGLRFGRLFVVERAPSHIQGNGKRVTMWFCRCDCGNLTKASSGNLKAGLVQSCGCLRSEFAGSVSATHGMSKSRFYKIWRGMLDRTTNPNNKRYSDYGGRGIKVAQEWLKFENFKRDMYQEYLNHSEINGEDNTTIDRINNDKGYQKDNCTWSTYKQQALNRRKKVGRKRNVETHERKLL